VSKKATAARIGQDKGNIRNVLVICIVHILLRRPPLLVLGIRRDVVPPGFDTALNLGVAFWACQDDRFPFLVLAVPVPEVVNPFVCDVGHCSYGKIMGTLPDRTDAGSGVSRCSDAVQWQERLSRLARRECAHCRPEQHVSKATKQRRKNGGRKAIHEMRGCELLKGHDSSRVSTGSRRGQGKLIS
jgi:hypothetical protein